MADKLIGLLNEASGTAGNAELRERLQKGHQTNGADHSTLVALLGLQATVHTCGSGAVVREELCVGPPGAQQIHLRHSSRCDGDGNAEGHWDLLVPAQDCLPNHPPKSADFSSVCHAVTLQGPELCCAILQGFKDIENRRVSLEKQWIALHVGKTPPTHPEQTLHLAPGLDLSVAQTGHICGLAWVETSMRLQDYLQQIGCKCPAGEGHAQNCPANPWVIGPVLNVIGRTVTFDSPVAAKGALGKWTMTTAQKQAIQQRISDGRYREWRSDRTELHTWPLPWLPAES